MLTGMIHTSTRLQSRVVRAITIGDIALLYTDFEGTTVTDSGKTVEARHRAVEVLRRQPDGSLEETDA